MKTLLHAWSVGREILSGSIKAHELPALAAEHGFDGVEWLDRLLPSYDAGDWQALGRAQERAGLKVSALSLCLEVCASPSQVAEQVDRAKAILGMCPILSVKTVRVSVGGGGWKSLNRLLLNLERLRSKSARDLSPLGPLSRAFYRLTAGRMRGFSAANHRQPPDADPWLLQSAAWALQPLARQARELGLNLALENHFGLTSRAQDLLEIVEKTQDGGGPLGVCLDTGNFSNGQEPPEIVENLAPLVSHVHFKTYQEDPAADAERLGCAAQMAALKHAGYAGLFSVEYQGQGEGLAGAAAGADLLRGLWN